MKKLIVLATIFVTGICNAQTWSALGTGADTVMALTVYNGNLIAGGYFRNAGGVPASAVASWNGSSWDSLGSGVRLGSSIVSNVYALSTFNNNLYVGGYFDYAGQYFSDHFAEWNGISWDSLGPIESSCMVLSLTNYNGQEIIGGEFVNAGWTNANHIAAWDGANWYALGAGLNMSVNAMVVYKGNLIVAGMFDSAGGVPANYIAEWNGSSWSQLGTGLNNTVFALAVYNGNLYAGGVFDSAGGVFASAIAEWNGTKWTSLTSGISYGFVEALTVYNGSLIVGGAFASAGSIIANNIAAWNGTTWTNVGAGVNAPVMALAVYSGNLYAGGYFTQAGSIHANGIAEWSEPLGINEIEHTANAALYPNPNTGQFTIESSVVSGESTIEIYNMLGEKIYSKQLTIVNSQLLIDIGAKSPGVYLYSLINENGGQIANGKFVIE
ncbi:MAG TPA: T9SS type A sorting domain-containing protein [Bacteroidia bacterium]|jgi:hypothetical protein|nr:T9SS type A sorting domain-containing protein [Bacteroidia bacterium]